MSCCCIGLVTINDMSVKVKLNAFLQDWKCIISMLLSENSSTELTNEDITNLTRLLCASVKKSVGERIVPATDNRKQYYTKAQRVSFLSVATFSSIFS